MLLVAKNLPANAGDARDLVWDDPFEDDRATHSNSSLENPTDRGAWLGTVYGVTNSWT